MTCDVCVCVGVCVTHPTPTCVKTAIAALTVAQAVVDGFKSTLEAAKYALTGAEQLVLLSKSSLDAANLVLEGAKRTLDAKDALKAVALAALMAAEQIVETSRHSLDVAKGVLEAAKAVVEGVKATVKAGLDAASAIAQFGLGGLIDVRGASFELALSAAEGGHFEVSITLQIMGGPPQTLSIYVDFKDLFSAAKSLANKAFDGISSLL